MLFLQIVVGSDHCIFAAAELKGKLSDGRHFAACFDISVI
jgi:hypothetical protein